ncbi:MAG: nucleotide exchange factor GrpE [Anaerolineae bacterium]|nr:MAG: nucleotide exchange factor GrpE [Anaerolineae bacterium]
MSKKKKKQTEIKERTPLPEEAEETTAAQADEQPAGETKESPAAGEELSPEALQTALEESKAQAAEYLDGWQRARAEFANYKKRIEREREQMQQNLAGEILKRYLPVVDDLELALKNRPQQGEGASWAEGIELIYRKMLSILEAQGVTPMQAEGQMFDPNLHEAVTRIQSDQHESDQIVEVVQQGYLIGDQVLRPARVVIAE